MNKTQALLDVATIKLSSVDKTTNENENIVRLCNYTDIYKNAFISNDMSSEFMLASATQNEIDGFQLRKGQIAITKDSEKSDDIGVPAYIKDDEKDVLLGYHLALITPKTIAGKYLNYYLQTQHMKKYFENNASGSGQRYTIAKDILEDLPLLRVPSKQQQEKIGELLFKLDEKIYLNTKINAELENLAKTIYDYWFVQFDFPNKDRKPYKSSGGEMEYDEIFKREIPVGWEIKTIKDFCLIKSGYAFDSDYYSEKGYKLITIKNVQNCYINPKVDNYVEFIPKNIPEYCLLKQGDILMSLTGNIGRVALMYEENCLLNQRVAVLLPTSKNLNAYCYYLFQSDYVKEKMLNIAGGSSQDNLSPIDTENFLIPFNYELAEKYNEIALPIMQQIVSLNAENLELAALRDFLLPLLMNGQVTINDNTAETEAEIMQFVPPIVEQQQNVRMVARAEQGGFDEATRNEVYAIHRTKVEEYDRQKKNRKRGS